MNNRQLWLLTAAVGGLLGSSVQLAQAGPKKLASKDAQIQALERRLLALEQRLAANEGASANPQPNKTTATDVPAVKQLDQKLKVLERKWEVEREVAADTAKKTPKLEASSEGVRFISPDGDHVVRLRGALQTDGKFFMDDNATPVGGQANGINLPDKFELKQARVWLEGTLFKWFDFKIMPDFGKNGGTLLQDAYLDIHYLPYASLNIGKQKTPLSLERLQGDSDGTFLERAYPTQLASNRDVGIVLHGSFSKPGDEPAKYIGSLDFKNFFSYQLGVFNGSGDNGAATNLSDSSTQDDKEFVGRIWAHPFQKSGITVLEGLGIGIAGSFETPNNRAVFNNLSSANGGGTIVNYTALGANAGNLVASGDHYRIYPQVYWYYGPFGLMGEYALSSQELSATKTGAGAGTKARITQDNQAWQILASYVLTGEDNTFQGVKPRKGFDPFNGNWGALQVAARYSELDIDKDSFANQGINNTAANRFVFLDPSKSVSSANAWAMGLNWYLNRNILVRADYEQTYFSGGAGTATNVLSRPMEKVFSTRFQLSF